MDSKATFFAFTLLVLLVANCVHGDTELDQKVAAHVGTLHSLYRRPFERLR